MRGAKTRFGWIRHGVTEWNALGKIQGVTDIPLNPDGMRQARLLADRLQREGGRWHGVVCSDLRRAEQTASIVAERLGIPVVRDERLRERSFGAAEGTTEPERLARWGEDWRRRVPDQEQDEAVIARGLAFTAEWSRLHERESWLVVSHGSFLARVLHTLCPDLDDSYIRNVSLTVLERRGEDWFPLIHNCTRHLDDRALG